MRGPGYTALVAALASLAGCGGGRGTLVVTITASPALSGVVRLDGTASAGAGELPVAIVPPGALSFPPERKYGIDAPAGAGVVLRLSAFDGRGAMLATGEARATVQAGARTDVTLVLEPPMLGRDGGVDAWMGDAKVPDGGADGPPRDLAPQVDLVVAKDLSQADLRAPQDLAVPDLVNPVDLAQDAAAPKGDMAASDGATAPDLVMAPCTRDADCQNGLCNWKLSQCSSPMANGGPCSRDVECGSGLCNWALSQCSTPAGNGGTCSRDLECMGGLCNWNLSVCSSPMANGGSCSRDLECADGLCNWALSQCAALAPDGARCSRDLECVGGLCNWSSQTCKPKQNPGGPCGRNLECVSGQCDTNKSLCS